MILDWRCQTPGRLAWSRVLAATRGLAEYAAWTGSAGQSLTWLQRAYAISPEGEDLRIVASGLYDKVRNDPRFRTGLEQAHTQIYARVRRASLGVAAVLLPGSADPGREPGDQRRGAGITLRLAGVRVGLPAARVEYAP